MANVVGVRFRNVGKIYYFDPKDYEIKKNDHVIVETARGMEYGRVVMGPKEVNDKEVVHPLKEVIRPATGEDEERETWNRQKEKEAFQICRQKIREHNLDMKLIDAEYTFDNSKVLFYFTADGRVDFRLLVKDLASIFKTRIELRQIGVRDETKILGGIGICGRALCCHTWLSDFVPVSIKMAKEQNLSLNQTKISGVCGRLMCCLKNEQDTYEELNKKLPSNGDLVTLPDGSQGTVHSVNVLRQLVKVVTEEDDQKEILEYPVDELKFRSRKKKGKNQENHEGKDQKEGKELKDPKESKPVKEPKEAKTSKEVKEPREAKASKEAKEPREAKASKEAKEPREAKASKEAKEPREAKASREAKEPREAKASKETRDNRNSRVSKENRDVKEPKEQKESRDIKDQREIKDSRETVDKKGDSRKNEKEAGSRKRANR